MPLARVSATAISAAARETRHSASLTPRRAEGSFLELDAAAGGPIADWALNGNGTEETGVPFGEAAHAAACIPGARIVALPTKNHVLMPDERAWPMFLEEIERFVLGSNDKVQEPDPAAVRRKNRATAG